MSHRPAIVRVVSRFLSTTTLHGFKYLYGAKRGDRFLWVISVCASACCSGALCAVLWARFAQVPTLLYLLPTDIRGSMPAMGICLPAHVVAKTIVKNLGYNDTLPLAQALTLTLRGKSAPDYQLSYLEYFLKRHNYTLSQVLLQFSSPCAEVAVKCRVNGRDMPCHDLVHKDVTMFGACCVLRPSKRSPINTKVYGLATRFDIILNCTVGGEKCGYELYTQHESRGWVKSTLMWAGYVYDAPLNFQAVREGDHVQLVDGTCVSDEAYSRTVCQARCVEMKCGCSDPLLDFQDEDYATSLPQCALSRIHCLRNWKLNFTCKCLPSCWSVTTYMSLKENEMNENLYVVDSFYNNLHEKTMIVLNIHAKKVGSHVFARKPTETWLTLLSSLGGVFNMFLGVGLFSALEIVYFIFVRFPMAWKKSLEMVIETPRIHNGVP